MALRAASLASRAARCDLIFAGQGWTERLGDLSSRIRELRLGHADRLGSGFATKWPARQPA